MARIYLPNGCSFTEPVVNPSNWKSKTASVKKPWYITYRYRDPAHLKEYPDGKLVAVRKMNRATTREDRAMVVEQLLARLDNILKVHGYNPITGKSTPFYDTQGDIIPEMPVMQALKIAAKKLKCSPGTRGEIGYMLKYLEPAINNMQLHTLAIGSVQRKHVLKILEGCARAKDKWTPHIFNKYRSYLMMLFKVIVKFEALGHNPVDDLLEKEKTTRKLRDTLTDEQRKVVADHLRVNYYTFYRFVQIFFHSGARISELLTVKVKDVNLSQQQYILTIKKGAQAKEVRKTIKNISLPYWQELLDGADKDDFVFSMNLEPGAKQIRPDQISKRWKKRVKDKLKDHNITADLYSLKHLNTTEVVDLLGEQDAAKLNDHDGTAMVVNIYDTKREQRQHERLKKVNNEF